MSKILWVNSKTQTITKKNRNKKMAKNMLAPSFPTYRLSVSPSLFYHSDSSIPRLHSLQGLFCSGLWNVVLVLQKQDLHLCVKSFTAQWELRQTKKRPSHTHTHTETWQCLNLMVSVCMWTVPDFLYLQFSHCSHVSGLLFSFFWLE